MPWSYTCIPQHQSTMEVGNEEGICESEHTKKHTQDDAINLANTKVCQRVAIRKLDNHKERKYGGNKGEIEYDEAHTPFEGVFAVRNLNLMVLRGWLQS